MKSEEIFEVDLEDVYHYRMSYGGQSAYFHGLQNGKLVASRCTNCGHVWLPLRPTCSKCYSDADELVLSGRGEILTIIMLPQVPAHLKHLDQNVATALILPEGADTCIKAFVVGDKAKLGKGARVEARYLPVISTVGDFYFVPCE